MKSKRVKTVYINSIITFISQIMQVLLGFWLRRIFIKSLGVVYLGYNSVFMNVLQMLNLADMGIGVAITSFLYKPLAEHDEKQVNALMYIYKRVYQVIGIIVILLGLITSFFLALLIPDASHDIWYIRILFYINLIGTASTYFLAYKRTLLIADQKSYITSIVDTVLFVLFSLAQLLSLRINPNYIVYLVLGIAKTIISNVIISISVNNNYGKIKKLQDDSIYQEFKSKVVGFIKDVFVSRIGAFIYYSTDNIIISIFRGSLQAGYLSNYTMITTQIQNLVNSILASIQATFGNFISLNNDKKKQADMTDNYLCVVYCIGNFAMLCSAFLLQPFIKLFYGQSLLLSLSTAFWLSVNLMLTIMLCLPSQVFTIYKLFHYDRPVIAVSAILNIIISVLLVKNLGIDGVLIGTFLTSLIYLYSRLYIISRKVYDNLFSHYFIMLLRYWGISLVSYIIISYVVKFIPGENFFNFILRIMCVVSLAVFVPLAMLIWTKEFVFIKEKIVPQKLRWLFSKFKILIGTMILIIIFIILGNCLDKFGGGYKADSSYTAEQGNKSLERKDSFLNEQKNITCNKYIHISIDDTIDLFKDITFNNYNSIFENETLACMKELHDKYGMVVSFYVYYSDEDFNLSLCKKKYKEEFEENSEWLRFGFHSYDKNTAYGDNGRYGHNTGTILEDYNKVMLALKDIAGENCIDNFIRMQSFQGTKDEIKLISKTEFQPIIGLLTSDDKRRSYYLNDKDNEFIYSHDILYKDDIFFISTDIRIEFVDDINKKIKEFDSDSWNNQLDILEVFTHEWSLTQENISKINDLCEFGVEKGYIFAFPEDICYNKQGY